MPSTIPAAEAATARGHAPLLVGCAGWSIPRAAAARLPGEGSHLQRYAGTLGAAEINTSFYRPHGAVTYQRWAATVPAAFRFSVKLPKEITHARRLGEGSMALLDEFLGPVRALGTRLGCLLVQLPPSLGFDPATAEAFFGGLRQRHTGDVALEPRHAGWFDTAADAVLQRHRIARVLADPVLHAPGAAPGGWDGLIYLRLHGAPRTYWSAYERPWLETLAARMRLAAQQGATVWCIFDNTAGGAAVPNALDLQALLGPGPVAT